MRTKLYQFDNALRDEIVSRPDQNPSTVSFTELTITFASQTTATCAMYTEEQVLIEEAFTFLSQITSNPASPTSITPSGPHIEVILSILSRWPAAQRFPGTFLHLEQFESIYIDILTAVIDLGRLMVAYCANTPCSPEDREKFFDRLFNASEWSSVVSLESPMLKPQETNVLLLLRTITNYFQEGTPVNDGRWVQQVKQSAFLSTAS